MKYSKEKKADIETQLGHIQAITEDLNVVYQNLSELGVKGLSAKVKKLVDKLAVLNGSIN